MFIKCPICGAEEWNDSLRLDSGYGNLIDCPNCGETFCVDIEIDVYRIDKKDK